MDLRHARLRNVSPESVVDCAPFRCSQNCWTLPACAGELNREQVALRHSVIGFDSIERHNLITPFKPQVLHNWIEQQDSWRHRSKRTHSDHNANKNAEEPSLAKAIDMFARDRHTRRCYLNGSFA